MIFIPITAAAAAFQVARNALQRGLLGEAGPWGATLVRFAFGLPFSLVFVAIAFAVWPGAQLRFASGFWLWAMAGAAAQVGATAALLVAMGRSGFALGAAFQQSSLPFTAIFGALVLNEAPGPMAAFGVALATVGLLALSWPRRASAHDWPGVVFGLTSGACYAVALNAYRGATLILDPAHPALAAVVTASVTQAAQTLGLTAFLWWKSPASLRAVARGWRASLGAGFAGATASALWVTALAMTPAAPVRAVGVLELPLSALAGRTLFSERLSGRQILFGALTAAGVVLSALA